ncbi:MAG: hypothetical protein Q9160_006383 [Pyrenula sp. 1 TL-2023]
MHIVPSDEHALSRIQNAQKPMLSTQNMLEHASRAIRNTYDSPEASGKIVQSLNNFIPTLGEMKQRNAELQKIIKELEPEAGDLGNKCNRDASTHNRQDKRKPKQTTGESDQDQNPEHAPEVVKNEFPPKPFKAT